MNKSCTTSIMLVQQYKQFKHYMYSLICKSLCLSVVVILVYEAYGHKTVRELYRDQLPAVAAHSNLCEGWDQSTGRVAPSLPGLGRYHGAANEPSVRIISSTVTSPRPLPRPAAILT